MDDLIAGVADEVLCKHRSSRLPSCSVNRRIALPNMNASNDDAESVDAFLERIASLKDKRDREDEERTKKLEDEILQGRRERQARRAGKCFSPDVQLANGAILTKHYSK